MKRTAWIVGAATISILLLCACQPAPVSIRNLPSPTQTPPAQYNQPPLEYSADGATKIGIAPWKGPALLHIRAEKGAQPFQVVILNGLDRQVLVNTAGPFDEYRGVPFASPEQAGLEIQGDRAWKVTVIPPSVVYFPSLKVPGKHSGQGSAILLLEGEHSIAIFEAQNLEKITAWAYGPDGEGGILSYKQTGSYKGRAVLPKTARWLIISASGPWSVEVQGPCCEVPP